VPSQTTDGANDGNKETRYNNEKFSSYYGKYNSTTKIKMSIKAFATWVVGLGWEADTDTTVLLNHISGAGEDTFLSIIWNMLVIKKVHGDAYAEIIRDSETGTLINIKPLSPQNIIVVYNDQGIIDRYEQASRIEGKKNKVIFPQGMLHLVNDRVADSIRGDSVIESLEWNIEAQEEARRTHRKMLKRNGVVRVIEVDTEDRAKRDAFKTEWKTAIDNGDVLIIPKDVAEAKDWGGNLDTNGVLAWLNYLDSEFYQIIGIPKIIIGGSGDIEGDSKIAFLTFEPTYKRSIRELKDDLYNQLGVKVDFILPPSLKAELQSNEAKNTSQTGFQPNDIQAGNGA
jgi:hypothetical protein